jgi:hypothetical protein
MYLCEIIFKIPLNIIYPLSYTEYKSMAVLKCKKVGHASKSKLF